MKHEIFVPKNWIGHELGIEPPLVTELGSLETKKLKPIKDREELNIKYSPVKGKALHYPVETNIYYKRQSYIYADFKNKKQYRVTFNPLQMAKLKLVLSKNVEPRRKIPSTEIEKLINPKLAASTEDDRVRIEHTEIFPNSAIVYVDGASGAMISERAVLTAAHVLTSGGRCKEPGDPIVWSDFDYVIPGMRRYTACGSGDNSLACRVAPFGEIGVSSAFLPEGWMTPAGPCADWAIYDPYNYIDDIAIIFLDEPIGQETGWFDVRPLTVDQILNALLMNRGYPDPLSLNSPPDLERWEMWGSGNYFNVSSFDGEVNGIYHLIRLNTYLSHGHSGSPIYQWRATTDGWRPEIVGIFSHFYGTNKVARRVAGVDTILDFARSLHID